MRKSFRLAGAPERQCYDCHASGDCCRGYFEVYLTPEERERIESQGWAERPEFAGVELFRERGGRLALGNRPDGPCLFLGDDGLCRIHAEFGEAAKPLACRLYPFVFVPVGDEVRLELRFDCPSVARSLGRPAQAHEAALRELLPLATAGVTAPPPPDIRPGVPATWAKLKKINHWFERLVTDISLDLPTRLRACVELTGILWLAPLEEVKALELGPYVGMMVTHVTEQALVEEVERRRPARPTRVLFRQLAALYGRRDRLGEPARPLGRLLTSLRMIAGVGRVPRVRGDLPEATFRALEATPARFEQAATLAIARYYSVRLGSLGYCGPGFYGHTMLEGLDALWLTYPLLCWFARLHAAARRLTQIDVEAVAYALQVIDHSHGRNPLLDTAAERLRREKLTQYDSLRELIDWYGDTDRESAPQLAPEPVE